MNELMNVIHHIAQSQLTYGTSGNTSRRDGSHSDLFVITPSGISWQEINESDLVTLNIFDGQKLAGHRLPSTEWRFHQLLYAKNPWVQGIVHLHSQYATILSTLSIPVNPVHYQLVPVADRVPVVAYATFGTAALAQSVSEAIDRNTQAILIENHGLVAVGTSVANALKTAEDVEWTAMIQYHAMLLGTPRILKREEILEVRAQLQHYGQSPISDDEV